MDLPGEILGRIFALALPKRLDQEGRRRFQTIRSVSPFWLSVALGSRELWAGLSIGRGIRISREFTAEEYPRRLRLWFARAGPLVELELEVEGPRSDNLALEDRKALI